MRSLYLFLSVLVTIPSIIFAKSVYNRTVVRNHFNCPPCDMNKCVMPTGCEVARETGVCGCCYTCVRKEGHNCGVYTERCGKGLKCLPKPGTSKPIQSLFRGEGTCTKATPRLDFLGKFKFPKKRSYENHVNDAYRELAPLSLQQLLDNY